MEHIAISAVIFKFANSLDLKDWESLGITLSGSIECDYKDLRGESNVYTKSEFIRLRKEALEYLKVHHLFFNLEIKIIENLAFCRASAMIYRLDDKNKYFNSHVIYDFELTMQDGIWKINKIKQSVLWNEGDSSIHKGARIP